MAQLSGEGWRHFQRISCLYENGEVKDQKIKATEIIKKGKPLLKQWQFKSLCSLNCEDRTFLLGKVYKTRCHVFVHV